MGSTEKFFEKFSILKLRQKCPNTGVITDPNTGKYGPEITSYLDTFHAVSLGETLFLVLLRPADLHFH